MFAVNVLPDLKAQDLELIVAVAMYKMRTLFEHSSPAFVSKINNGVCGRNGLTIKKQ